MSSKPHHGDKAMTTFQKVKEHTQSGDYQETQLDSKKNASTLLLLQVSPKVVSSSVPLSGRGIKKMGSYYQVSDNAWDKLKEQHSWATDF